MEVIRLDFNDELKIKFPKIVEFQINSICNSHCTICPYSSIAKKFGNSRMEDDQIEKIAQELDDHANEIERIIPYLNNEPFIDNRFINLLRRLKSKKKHTIEVSTNASLLTKEVSKIIVNEKLIDDFRISFFAGNEQEYKQLMPNLDFNKCKNNIKNFLEINNDVIPYQITLILVPWMDMKKNIAQVKELFPNANIHPFGFLDRAGNLEQKNNLAIDEDKNVKLIGCNLDRPFERMCILANGDVILCSQDWSREEVQGNVFETSIYEVWNSKKAIDIKRMILGEIPTESNFICKKCKLAILADDENDKYLNFKGDIYMDENDEKRREIDESSFSNI